MSGLFITGTDTGCGKTAVTTAIAREAHSRGWKVRALKPIETGVEPGMQSDALRVARAAGDERATSELCAYALDLPSAPVVAASRQGVTIDVERLRSAYARASEGADLVLVEGAGGLLVPIAPGLDMAGLALLLDLPVLLVARARLGTINHTLLSVREAQRRGLRLAGVVVSHTEPELSSADRANLDWLLQHLPVPCFGELAHGLPDAGASGLALRSLWDALALRGAR